jgi:hypothetical protein
MVFLNSFGLGLGRGESVSVLAAVILEQFESDFHPKPRMNLGKKDMDSGPLTELAEKFQASSTSQLSLENAAELKRDKALDSADGQSLVLPDAL